MATATTSQKRIPASLKKAVVHLSLPRPLMQIQEWLKEIPTTTGKIKLKGKRNIALFNGPKDQGKYMAAAMLASHAGMPLYRVELSKVMSKYIGETEKNLSALFKFAADRQWILFFDEADALFGKRTSVKDSHDRYANQEVSYLMQKIEAHNGLVILATNQKKNIDDAFIRRIRFIVDFPFPDGKK